MHRKEQRILLDGGANLLHWQTSSQGSKVLHIWELLLGHEPAEVALEAGSPLDTIPGYRSSSEELIFHRQPLCVPFVALKWPRLRIIEREKSAREEVLASRRHENYQTYRATFKSIQVRKWALWASLPMAQLD